MATDLAVAIPLYLAAAAGYLLVEPIREPSRLMRVLRVLAAPGYIVLLVVIVIVEVSDGR